MKEGAVRGAGGAGGHASVGRARLLLRGVLAAVRRPGRNEAGRAREEDHPGEVDEAEQEDCAVPAA